MTIKSLRTRSKQQIPYIFHIIKLCISKGIQPIHVKLVWLSVDTMTTFIIGVAFKIPPGRSVKAMTYSMLNLKFLLESNEQKPTRNTGNNCSSGGYLNYNSWIYRSASTCILVRPDPLWSYLEQNGLRRVIFTRQPRKWAKAAN